MNTKTFYTHCFQKKKNISILFYFVLSSILYTYNKLVCLEIMVKRYFTHDSVILVIIKICCDKIITTINYP